MAGGQQSRHADIASAGRQGVQPDATAQQNPRGPAPSMTNVVDMTDKRPGPWNWRRIVLVASLMLNLFLVALIGGHWLRRGINVIDANEPPLARALAAAEANLSRSDATAFDAVMRQGAPHYADAAQQFEQARRDLGSRIMAEPYDPAAVRQAFVTWKTSWNRFVDAISDTLVEALSKVSPEGRRKLIAARREAVAGFRGP